MVVDIVIYSLILPSSVFGLVQEEYVPSWWCVKKQKNDCSRAERRGEGRDTFSLHNTRRKTA
jgi:hypothetical protein